MPHVPVRPDIGQEDPGDRGTHPVVAALEHDPRNVAATRRPRRARRACRTWRVAVPPGPAGRPPRCVVAGSPRPATRDTVLIALPDLHEEGVA